jgi:uncharacterized protein YjbI with pentapeptide repeats
MPDKSPKTCQVKMFLGTPCGRELYDGEKCICHSEKKDKDVKLFQAELDESFTNAATKHFDLIRFVFPMSGWHLPKEIEKDLYLQEARFLGEANFANAQFSGEAHFIRAQFSSWAHFWRAQFSGEAKFFGAQFAGEADFGWA